MQKLFICVNSEAPCDRALALRTLHGEVLNFVAALQQAASLRAHHPPCQSLESLLLAAAPPREVWLSSHKVTEGACCFSGEAGLAHHHQQPHSWHEAAHQALMHWYAMFGCGLLALESSNECSAAWSSNISWGSESNVHFLCCFKIPLWEGDPAGREPLPVGSVGRPACRTGGQGCQSALIMSSDPSSSWKQGFHSSGAY